MATVFKAATNLGRAVPFSALDFSAQALDAAELSELTQLAAQREVDRRSNASIAVQCIGRLDSYTSAQQLHDIVSALAQLSERIHLSYQSAAMNSLCDAVNEALGWAEGMLEDTPTDKAQDAHENYGGTTD